jgi:hypothetical protein
MTQPYSLDYNDAYWNGASGQSHAGDAHLFDSFIYPADDTRRRATLVVIDMQYGFEASRNPETIEAVKREIAIHINHGWPIVIVECRPGQFCRTYPQIMNMLDMCPTELCTRVEKEHNDGSQQVLRACREMGFSMEQLRVCGVNTTQCVQETVVALSYELPNSCIEVVKDACNDWNENDFSAMLRCANVVIRDGNEVRAY